MVNMAVSSCLFVYSISVCFRARPEAGASQRRTAAGGTRLGAVPNLSENRHHKRASFLDFLDVLLVRITLANRTAADPLNHLP